MPDPFGSDNCGPDYAPHLHEDVRCSAEHLGAQCGRPVHKDPQHVCGVVSWTDEPSTFSGAEPIMQFFDPSHLRKDLAAISRPLRIQRSCTRSAASLQPFCDLALWIVETIPRNPERSVALRKLLEAKDAAVRASIAKPFRPLPAAIPLPGTFDSSTFAGHGI